MPSVPSQEQIYIFSKGGGRVDGMTRKFVPVSEETPSLDDESVDILTMDDLDSSRRVYRRD